MNATRPEASTEDSSGPGPDLGSAAAARAAVGLVLAGLAACVVGAVLPVRRTFAVGPPARAVGSVTAGSHDGWAVVMLGAVALILAVAGRRGPRPRAAFAGTFGLGLGALFVALVVDRSGVHAVGAVSVAGRLVDGEVRAGAGLYVEAVGAALLAVGGLTGALLGPAHSRPANDRATHAQQTPT